MPSLNASALLELGCPEGREEGENALIQQTDVWGFRHIDKHTVFLLSAKLVNFRGSGLQLVVFR